LPYIVAGVGVANYSLSGGPHTAAGYANAAAEGGLVGSPTLICVAGFCGPLLVAGGVELAIGGAYGAWDYSHSEGCHTSGGCLESTLLGAFASGPYPVDKWFKGVVE